MPWVDVGGPSTGGDGDWIDVGPNFAPSAPTPPQAPQGGGDLFASLNSLFGTVANNVGQGAIGAAKSVPSTAIGLGEALRSLFGAETGTSGTAEALGLGADNPQQEAGMTMGKLGQFGLGALATGGSSVPAQMAGEGALAGLLGAGQSGEFGGEATATAIGGAAGPLVGKVAQGVKNFGPRVVNSLVKPVNEAFNFGKNPGRGIANEGIVATSLEDLGNKLATKSEELGAKVDAVLKPVKVKVDLSPALEPIDAAISKAVKQGDATLLGRLRQLRDSITHNFLEEATTGKLIPGEAKALVLNPFEANQAKRELADLIKWRQGDMYADDINAVGRKVWGKISDIIEKQVPAVKHLNSRWADVITADKAVARRAVIEQRHDMIGLPGLLFSGGGAAAGGVVGGLPGASVGAVASGLGRAALGSTLSKTGLASLLAKLSPEEIALLRGLIPGLTAGATSQPQTPGTQSPQ